jgi:chromosome segregation ATPase
MYGGPAPLAKAPSARPNSVIPVGTDVSFDARLLADYGTPPHSWFTLPFYAWRVMRRQGELKAALEGRRAEAERTKRDAEDALVAFAQRVRTAMEADADKASEFAAALIELRKTEDVLRSRDSVLASEQDAHNARLAAVAVRLSKLEAELAQAQAGERKIAIELATAQAAISREETKLKRVETELRAAQRRQESPDEGAST